MVHPLVQPPLLRLRMVDTPLPIRWLPLDQAVVPADIILIAIVLTPAGALQRHIHPYLAAQGTRTVMDMLLQALIGQLHTVILPMVLELLQEAVAVVEAKAADSAFIPTRRHLQDT